MPKREKGRKGKRQVPEAAKTAAQPRKIPRVAEAVDFDNSRPTWSLAILDLAPPFGWLFLDEKDIDGLLARFRQWETMTWGQILWDGKWRNHHLDVSRCSHAAQERLKYLKMDDQEQLVSLAVNSKARVIGILDRATFKVLWWDPGHQVCPSPLKGT